jgi:hypothetical protein
MATVTQPTNSSKVYYAHMHDQSGVLGKLGDQIVFLADGTLELTVVEPPDFNWLTVLGLVGLADSQAVCDKIRGGYAKVACGRKQEVN